MKYTVLVRDEDGDTVFEMEFPHPVATGPREFGMLLWAAGNEMMDDEPLTEEDEEAAAEEQRDYMLSQQEQEDFAQDGDWENMPPGGWSEEGW